MTTQQGLPAAQPKAVRWIWAAAALSLLPAASLAQDRVADPTRSPSATEAKLYLAKGEKDPGAKGSAAKSRKLKGSAYTLWKVHQADLIEIKLSELAKSNAEHRSVKKYAEWMITDHTACDAKVTTGLKKLNVDLDQPAPASDKAEMDAGESLANTLRSTTGADFDAKYIKAMVDDHEKAVSLVSAAQADAAQKNIRPFLNQLLPVLQHHLEMALKLQRTHGGMANMPQGRTKDR